MNRALLLLVALLAVGSVGAEFPDAKDWQPTWSEVGAEREAVWLDDDLLAGDWIQLDNRSLFGWKATAGSKWTAKDEGGIVAGSEQPGWLMTTPEWEDFELIVDYKSAEGANSGVFIRTELEPKNPATDCYEINIAPPSNPFPTGSIVEHKKATYAKGQLEQIEVSDQVHRLHIIAKGPHIQVKLDGELVTDFTDDSEHPRLKGYIGLQQKEGTVTFERVLLKPLGTKPIFNGKDLAGWKTDLAGPAKFSVTKAGELEIIGGAGQAESEGEYGDFVLQFECKTNGEGLNSGVFFRSIPGDKMNGYECQVQNQYTGGDRTKPKDCGTGGIYRRINARLVNANDHEWFHVTVNANGPHFAVWVNGIQVTDWTDTRPPHENPRNGLRLKPGTFCLQAHDPTTDLLFRDIRVGEMVGE
ncbi:3-keto-disaccharide hydrolase [Aeoliella sp. SH292]|uniref:3-keto-disaccharide hydrolase n=1 Tax=Aeoliella sp. SH292 TaxID=3454464 RepID=UPI003F986A31